MTIEKGMIFHNIRESWRQLPLGKKVQIGGSLLFGVGAGVDITTTNLGLQQGFMEMNPFANHLIDNFGILGATIGLKVAGWACILGFCEAVHRKTGGYVSANASLYSASLIQMSAAINNIYQLSMR